MAESAKDFILLHLADSALPTGAFAYSAGLEAMIEFGFIKNADQLGDYIFEIVRQTIAFELPFLYKFYHSDFINESEQVKELLQNYDASFVSSGMYEGSLTLGKNWIRIMEDVLQLGSYAFLIEKFLNQHQLKKHYLYLMAMCFRELGYDTGKIYLFHISSIIRDQISAAIRLGIMGPIEGHSLQFTLYKEACSLIADLKVTDDSYSRRTGFIPDVAQMLQKNVYSRLFKN